MRRLLHLIDAANASDTPRRFAPPLFIEGNQALVAFGAARGGLTHANENPLYEEGCPSGRGV